MLASRKKQSKNVNRSRSRSLSPQGSKLKASIKGNIAKKQVPKTSRPAMKNKSPLNPSLGKSLSKKSLNKSASNKKQLNRSASQPRVGSGVGQKKEGKRLRERSQSKEKEKLRERSQSKEKQKGGKPQQTPPPPNNVKGEERDMGVIFVRPEHDKVLFRNVESTDPVFEKYLEMVNNDNDASYVMNALPELRNFRKEDESQGRDFVSGRISRLSGIFQNLSVDKVISAGKRVPPYYQGQCGKNITLLRIVLQTKFKVEVDLGFLQYSLDGDKLTVFRIYVSKIYRRMNYLGFVYLESLKGLMAKHPGADRWSIFILERNVGVHKFFKYLGFHIEKIATESKNKTVDYFQEFTLKKKELSTVLATMTK